MKKIQVKKPLWKRIVIISSVVVLAAAPLLYAWTSVQAWNTANSATTQASADLKKSVDDTLAATSPTSTQSDLDTVLKNYNGTLTKGPCELAGLYEWQSGLPGLKDQRQKCLDTNKSSEELASSLANLQTFLKEESSAALLVKQAIESTASTTDYTAAATTWQKVADDKSLVTEDAFKPVGAKVIEVSTAIATAYTSLASANTKQDKTAYDGARKAVTDSYTHITEVKTVSKQALSTLVDAVAKAYSAA